MQGLQFIHFVRNRANSDQQVYDALKTIDLTILNAQGYDILVRCPVRKLRPNVYERVLRETALLALAMAYPPEHEEGLVEEDCYQGER